MGDTFTAPAGGEAQSHSLDVYPARSGSGRRVFQLTDPDLKPWERQTGEPSKGFHAFCHYRDIPVNRTLLKAYLAHRGRCMDATQLASAKGAPKTYPRRWGDWSIGWGWVTRAQLWDREIDRLTRDKLLKEQTDARARHARTAQAAMTALTIPVKATLEALQDPEVLKRIITSAKTSPKVLAELIAASTRAAFAIPGLITIERLSLGMATEQVEIDDKRDDTSLAGRIASDPEAAELAIRLLDRLAGTTTETETLEVTDGAGGEPDREADGAGADDAADLESGEDLDGSV